MRHTKMKVNKTAKSLVRYDFRERREIDWSVYFDTSYDKLMARQRPTVPYGLKTHNFRRIITQKHTRKGTQFLIEWEDFQIAEASWEPMSILPKNIESVYFYPEVSPEALLLLARQLESAIQRRLARNLKHTTVDSFVIDFPLDVCRYVFGCCTVEHPVEKSGFCQLPLSESWDYFIDKHYNRSQLMFPVYVEPKLTFRKVYTEIRHSFEWRRVPVEKIRLTLSFQPICKHLHN